VRPAKWAKRANFALSSRTSQFHLGEAAAAGEVDGAAVGEELSAGGGAGIDGFAVGGVFAVGEELEFVVFGEVYADSAL